MKKMADIICSKRKLILLIASIFLIFSIIGVKLTNINYDILVYLPEEIETVEGQKILTEDFDMGAYTIVMTNNMASKDILSLSKEFEKVDGVNQVVSLYDVLGTTVPTMMLPTDIIEKFHKEETDILFVTFKESISSSKTIEAIRAMKEIASEKVKISGMSAMVLDTMDLSDKEIVIYVLIAVVLCLLVLELTLDSYLVPILLLLNIGLSIIFNLGTNIFLGEISYITKALVAVLQLGVTTDFSIFLYHAYEKNKNNYKNPLDAMSQAIVKTFTSVTGSSLTTIAGFLVLCTMNLTLGRDLGIVMAKGVLLGVIGVLTIFPSLLLVCDKWINKTKHKPITIKFTRLNKLVVKHYRSILIIFVILFVPLYLANQKVEVYYKIDESLPKNLDSIVANKELQEKFNLVSPEIILLDKNVVNADCMEMINRLENVAGIDFVLGFSKLKDLGLTEDMLPEELQKIFVSDKYQMLLLNSVYEIASEELNEQIEKVNKIIKEYDENSILAGEGPLMRDLVTISDTDFKNVNYSSIICILIIMFLVLKSLSLPILLIMGIEFAIFFNMAFAYFGGITLPFVAPIVLGTIELGATIDYAILLTTNYLENRKKNTSKKEAMLDALNYCSNSIFVSGMCFFAATFGVGIYSDLEMVGALCTLISRGAIISMLVVLTILPAILLVNDKLIMKTTLNGKGNEKMKLKKKRLGLSICLGILLLIPKQAICLSKEETIYTKLNTDGSIKSVVVNNHLINNEKLDKIKDYSELENIININSEHQYVKENNLVTWNSLGSDIFYKGTTNKKLPITTKINYKLNGQNILLKDLIGKDGDVVIEINFENQDKHFINGNNLYTPFVIVSGLVIQNDVNSNVLINNGKVIDNGSNYVVLGLTSPGLYNSLNVKELKNLDKLVISFTTKKFELPTIYSVVTPKIIEESDLKIFDKLDSLYSNVDVLQTSIDTILKSSGKLEEGFKTLEFGSQELAKNMDIVNDKLNDIKKGMISVNEGVEEIKDALLVVNKELNSDAYVNKIKELNYLIEQNTKTINFLSSNNKLLEESYINNNLENLTYEYLLNNNLMDLYQIKYQYENNYQNNLMLIKLLEGNKEGLTSSLDTFKNVSSLVNQLTKEMDKLNSGTSVLVNGIDEITKGVNKISSKMQELHKGVKTASTGMNLLTLGIDTFNKEGISKISKEAKNSKVLMTKVEDLVKLSNDYQSFSYKSNLDSNTKFIMVVDGVKVPEKEVIQNKEEVKLSLWDRFKNLFN